MDEENKKSPPTQNYQQQSSNSAQHHDYLNDTGFDYQEPDQMDNAINFQQPVTAFENQVELENNQDEDIIMDDEEYGEEEFDDNNDDYYQPPVVPAGESVSMKISIPLFGGGAQVFKQQTAPPPPQQPIISQVQDEVMSNIVESNLPAQNDEGEDLIGTAEVINQEKSYKAVPDKSELQENNEQSLPKIRINLGCLENISKQTIPINQEQIQQPQTKISLGSYKPVVEIPPQQLPQQSISQASAIPEVSPPVIDEQDMQIYQVPKKAYKKEKKKKTKSDLRRFYNLVKGKVLLEFDLKDRRARGQITYIFKRKQDEDLEEVFSSLKSEKASKIQMDLKFHAKQIIVETVGIVQKVISDVEKVPFEYPTVDIDQPSFQKEQFGAISHDMYTYETIEKREYDKIMNEPILQVKKIASVNLKKENAIEQLQEEIRIFIKFYLPVISDFGIQAVNYKRFDQLGSSNSSDSNGTYFHSQDRYDSQPLWMPLVDGSTFYPMDWSFKYIVPSAFTVIASGPLYIKKVEDQGENSRSLFHYKLKDKEKAPPIKLGFILGIFPYIHLLTDLPRMSPGYAFLLNQDKLQTFASDSKLYEKIVSGISADLQKLVNSPYPFNSLKIVFVPNLFTKKSRKQSLDFTGGLHILDEELIFPKKQLEGRHRTYKYIASSLSYDYFGAKVYEESPADFWLLQGIRERIGNQQKIMRFGILLYRYHIMKTINSIYKKAKHGFERYPLQSYDVPQSSEFMMNELVYEKSELIMHMIESMIDKPNFERIIRELYLQSQPYVTTKEFKKIYKKVCDLKLNEFSSNWITGTSCLKLSVSCNYNKKNNSLDLKLSQDSAIKDHLIFRKYVKDQDNLLGAPFLRRDPFYLSEDADSLRQTLEQLATQHPPSSYILDSKRNAQRFFEGEVNVMLYVTDGADISTQQQKMSLKYGESEVSINIPLSVKVKKTIQNKKKEYESMQIYGGGGGGGGGGGNMGADDEEDNEVSADNKKGGSNQIIDNNQWKFGLNDLELEDYPLETKNIFEVKNLESSVLWIRVDPDMEYIRKVQVKQEHNNWLFQLLLEKDIIGQIEAIKQLYKLTTHHKFIYNILQSVSTNEGYFFKVRKVALKYLQKMQTSQFDKYLSHEKFLIKIFNQRNFDEVLGFYKSNDFHKILEYYFDKYLLQTLSKCQEVPLLIHKELKDKLDHLNQATQPKPSTTSDPDQITISVQGTDLALLKGERIPRERLLMTSSDQIAQLLLKLLKENDNSVNPYDDANYLKTIIASLGNVLNFKMMPEIAKEVYRQFKLDQIGRFSLQFAITRGAISGYFKMRKQIYLFQKETVKHLDQPREEREYQESQIVESLKILDGMGLDLEKILYDSKWPLEVRSFIALRKIKLSFRYEGNAFLKALYIQLKVIDKFESERRIRDATEYAKTLVLFLEKSIKFLDFRDALLDSERSRAIVQVLWGFLTLPFNFLDCSFSFWIKRLYYFLYGNNVPPCLERLSAYYVPPPPEAIEYDHNWLDESKPGGGAGDHGMISREMQAKNRLQQQKVGGGMGTQKTNGIAQKNGKEMIGMRVGDLGPNGERIDKTDIKLRIILQPEGQQIKTLGATQGPPYYEIPRQQQQSGIKISLGSVNPDPFKGSIQPTYLNSSSMIQIGLQHGPSTSISFKNPSYLEKTQSQEQQDQMQLMRVLSSSKNNNSNLGGAQLKANDEGNGGGDQDMENEQSRTYDEFAEISFQSEWVQKLWDVTGHIWYHEEAADFLEPVSKEVLGGQEYFDLYLSMIDYPMDLTTIKEKIKAGHYPNIYDWRKDIETMFKNCRTFNEESSEIHHSAVKLENFYFQELRDYGLIDSRKNTRVVK